MGRRAVSRLVYALLVAAATMLFVGVQPAGANGVAWTPGDVFVSVGDGLVRLFAPTGTLLDTLDTGTGSAFTTGMCFDALPPTVIDPLQPPLTNLFVTDFTTDQVTKFSYGSVATQPNWAGGLEHDPESCTVDATGHIYVGLADAISSPNSAEKDIWKFVDGGGAGVVQATFNVQNGNRGADWNDVAADQCTLYYTSEDLILRRFDVCQSAQQQAFAAAPGQAPPQGKTTCYALRIRATGEVLVACSDRIVLFSPTGLVERQYFADSLCQPPVPPPTTPCSATEPPDLFALNLDPDERSFWTAGDQTGNVYRIDIYTGAELTAFNSVPFTCACGLAIYGEPTVGLGGGSGDTKSTPGKATGGGWIDPITGDVIGDATMLITSSSKNLNVNQKGTFGFTVQYDAGAPAPKGSLTFQDHDPNTIKISEMSVLKISSGSLPGQCPHASFKGIGSFNGETGHKFRVEVTDCGEGSALTKDQFEIHDEDTGYFAIGVLDGGTIQVHKS